MSTNNTKIYPSFVSSTAHVLHVAGGSQDD